MPNLLKYDLKAISDKKAKGVSNRRIAEELGLSRTTVNKIVKALESSEFSFESISLMPVSELEEHFSEKQEANPKEGYYFPDFEKVARYVARPGHTVQMAWEKYTKECAAAGRQAYGITQFRLYLDRHLEQASYANVIHHKAGETIEVDWAGTKTRWIDPMTGEPVYGYLFIGCLSFSGLVFAYCTPNMKEEWWIEAHVKMFEYFGGTTPYLISDNLKTGVKKNDKNEIVLNQTYKDLGRHYGIEIVPARVRKPKDKPLAENAVGKMTSRIIFELEERALFSVDEYNEAVRAELDKFNRKPFQKKDGSRYSVFENFEKPALKPLPQYPYEMAEWKPAKVQRNSHVVYKYNYYSVPTKYVGKQVKLKITKGKISVYLKDEVIATHILCPGGKGRYVTVKDHFPKHNDYYTNWDTYKFTNWAKTKGQNVYRVISSLFHNAEIEQTKYKSAQGILMLGKKYGDSRLNAACGIALTRYQVPTYSHIKSILEKKEDLFSKETVDGSQFEQPALPGIFTRGGDYFNDDKER